MIFLYAVIFPNNLCYLDKFLISLENQTDKSFTLFLVNDGVKDLKKRIQNYTFEIIFYNAISGSPIEIRIESLKKLALYKPTKIIFADTDDELCHNRVSVSSKYLDNFNYMCNDVTLVNKSSEIISKSYWTSRLEDNFIFDVSFINDKNIIGLGNSSVTIFGLNKILSKINNVSVGNDWFLFSLIDLDEKIIFTNSCHTLYRQYSDNMVGLGLVNYELVLKSLDTKINHYNNLMTMGFNQYDKFLQETISKKHIFTNNPIESNRQINLINNIKLNFFWWEITNFLNFKL